MVACQGRGQETGFGRSSPWRLARAFSSACQALAQALRIFLWWPNPSQAGQLAKPRACLHLEPKQRKVSQHTAIRRSRGQHRTRRARGLSAVRLRGCNIGWSRPAVWQGSSLRSWLRIFDAARSLGSYVWPASPKRVRTFRCPPFPLRSQVFQESLTADLLVLGISRQESLHLKHLSMPYGWP